MNKADKHSSTLIQGILSKSSPIEKQQTNMKMRIAARIDDAIQAKGWTRIQLANELNISRSLVTKWLSGTHNFTINTLVEVCHALDIELASMVTKDQKVKAQEKVYP